MAKVNYIKVDLSKPVVSATGKLLELPADSYATVAGMKRSVSAMVKSGVPMEYNIYYGEQSWDNGTIGGYWEALGEL